MFMQMRENLSFRNTRCGYMYVTRTDDRIPVKLKRRLSDSVSIYVYMFAATSFQHNLHEVEIYLKRAYNQIELLKHFFFRVKKVF